jgi:exportin-5
MSSVEKALEDDDNSHNWDIEQFLRLSYLIASHESIAISRLVLGSFIHMLQRPKVMYSHYISDLLPEFLNLAHERQYHFESLPDASHNRTYLYAGHEEEGQTASINAIGHYRTLCALLIDVSVQNPSIPVIPNLLQAAIDSISTLSTEDGAFSPLSFKKNSQSVLEFDKHVHAIDAAVKGYKSLRASIPDLERINHPGIVNLGYFEDAWKTFFDRLSSTGFNNPEISRRAISLLTVLFTKIFPSDRSRALALLDYILKVRKRTLPEYVDYSESMKELERSFGQDMLRMAAANPEAYMDEYERLKVTLEQALQSEPDDRLKTAYQAFLLSVVQRSTQISEAQRTVMFREYLNNVWTAWNNETLVHSLESFTGFCYLIGLGEMGGYLTSRNFDKVQDWASQPLDDDGKRLQDRITQESAKQPYRSTKYFLTASLERIELDNPAFLMAQESWIQLLPDVLPKVLAFIRYSQAFNSQENWAQQGLSREMIGVMKRICGDRFWQQGISNESREEFFARVNSSKATFEGLASTIRGAVRQVRESCYYIICSFDKFGPDFYRIPGLADTLSIALYENCLSLSSHHMSVLLNASRHLIESCPRENAGAFLPLMVSRLFEPLNRKIGEEWPAIQRMKEQQTEDDELGKEMKDESILRQLTNSSTSLATYIIDVRDVPIREDGDQGSNPQIPSFSYRFTIVFCL